MTNKEHYKLFIQDYFSLLIEIIEKEKTAGHDLFNFYLTISLLKEQLKSFELEEEFKNIMSYDERELL